MKIYRLGSNTSFERHWTTAVSIYPSSRAIRWSCPDCGSAANYPSGSFDVKIEGGSAYPDLLGCGAYPLLIVSEGVLSSWQRHGIGPLLSYPVQVVEAVDTKLSPSSAPDYFRVEVGGSIKVDIQGTGGTIKNLCYRCGEFETDPMLIKQFAFLDGSWDGTDLFSDKRFFPRVVFCTDSVKKLVEAENHTNFRFDEMISLRDDL